MHFPILTQARAPRVSYFGIVGTVLFTLASTNCFAGFWQKSPRPKFPPQALRESVEGHVVLHLSLASDGKVTSVTVLQSSGNAQLDAAAREMLLKRRARPEQLTPEILAKGKMEIIDFKQEGFRVPHYIQIDGHGLRLTRACVIGSLRPFHLIPLKNDVAIIRAQL